MNGASPDTGPDWDGLFDQLDAIEALVVDDEAAGDAS